MHTFVRRFCPRAFVAIVALALSFDVLPAYCAPGDLDTRLGGFGTGGTIGNLGFSISALVIDDVGRLVFVGGQNGEFHVQRRSGNRFSVVEDAPVLFLEDGSFAAAVALAPGGKIVVAGTVHRTATGNDFGVARLNPDLTLDETFGNGGIVVSDVDGDFDLAHGVAVQGDNKVIVVGVIEVSDGDFDWGIERFNEDGTLDDTFDENGKKAITYGGLSIAEDVALQGDSIVVAGTNDDDIGLIRLNSDGSVDTTFGSLGDTKIGFGSDDTAADMAIAPDGKIVMAATVERGVLGQGDVAVARFTADGIPDDSFGDEGKVVTALEDVAAAAGVDVQRDGKVVVVASNNTANSGVTIRYNSDGTLDSTFGDAGKAATPVNFASAVTAQTDGTIVAAGNILTTINDNLVSVGRAVRYRWDGALDAGGTTAITFDPDHVGSEVTSLAVGENGKLVAVGKVFIGDYAAAVARFQADYGQGLDLSFGDESPKRGVTMFGDFGHSEELRSVAVESDGDVIAAGQVTAQSEPGDFLIARVKDDGTPDAVCGGDGLAAHDFGNSADAAAAVAVGPSDKILAAGIGHSNLTGDDYAFARFKETCAIDTFSSQSREDPVAILADLGGDQGAAAMVVQSSTNLPILAGSSGGNIVLIRIRNAAFPSSGLEVDTSFGVGGKATLDTGGTELAVGLGQQFDGSLIVAGTVTDGAESDFLVARFTGEGVLDTSFGVDGIARASFNATDVAQALAVRSDDRIAVAGTTLTEQGNQFAVAQFLPEGFLDPRFANLTGKVTLRLGPDGDDVAQAVAFVADARLVLGGYSVVAGVRQFALAALQTSAAGTVSTTTTTSTTTTLPSFACGDPVNFSFHAREATGFALDADVTSSDALFILRTSVGSETCELCLCDVDDSGAIVASDALLTLKAAVGQQVTLACPACP
jgi:uncharacterized delta-60 repeat protein